MHVKNSNTKQDYNRFDVCFTWALTIFPNQHRNSIVLSTFQSFQVNGYTRGVQTLEAYNKPEAQRHHQERSNNRKKPSTWFRTNIISQLPRNSKYWPSITASLQIQDGFCCFPGGTCTKVMIDRLKRWIESVKVLV